MKRIKGFWRFLGLISCLLLAFPSCKKVLILGDLEIRLNNLSAKTFMQVTIGPTDFGTVPSGQISIYRKIPYGFGQVSGIAADSTRLSGFYTITGVGKHRWTFTLDTALDLKLTQDY